MQNILVVDLSQSKISVALSQEKAGNNFYRLIDEPETIDSLINGEDLPNLKSALSEALTILGKNLDHFTILIPADRYLSIQMEFPFREDKLIRQIIRLQTTEKLAFDIDDYLLHYRLIEAGEQNKFQVSLLPKSIVAAILDFLKPLNVEPDVITTTAGVLFSLTVDFDEENTSNLILASVGSQIHVCFQNNDSKSYERNIKIHDLNQTRRDLLISLTAIESLKGTGNCRICVIEPSDSDLIKSSISEDYEALSLSDPFKFSEFVSKLDSAKLSKLAPNFRVDDFYYSRIKQRALKLAMHTGIWLSLVIFSALLFFTGEFFINKFEIERIKSEVSDQIKKSIPALANNPSNSRDNILALNRNLEEQLSTLGSNSAWNPLDTFLELSKDLERASSASRSEFNITGLSISNEKIILEGDSPNYSIVEKIDRILSKNKEHFCSISKTTSPGALSSRTFSFSVDLCQK